MILKRKDQNPLETTVIPSVPRVGRRLLPNPVALGLALGVAHGVYKRAQQKRGSVDVVASLINRFERG